MTRPFFERLAHQVADFIGSAQQSLYIAVCWFSHRDIFERLKTQVLRGIKVELIIEYDTQNIHGEGLNFQELIDLGVHFYARNLPGLMHHKFAIADETRLLTGSFNWTYNSNAENLLLCEDPVVTRAFMEAFSHERETSRRIFAIDRVAPRPFSFGALFQDSHTVITDLRSRITTGASVWRIRTSGRRPLVSAGTDHGRLLFDPERWLDDFWQRTRVWDKSEFTQWTPFAKAHPMPASYETTIKLCTVKMLHGDVLVAEGKSGIWAMGIVEGAPQPCSGNDPFSSCRLVRWVRTFEPPYRLCRSRAPLSVTKFKGSALALLHELLA